MKPHSHNSIEIMYVENGTSLIEVEKTKNILKRSQFIVINSAIPHKLFVKEKCKMLNLEARAIEGISFPNIFNETPYYILEDTVELLSCIKRIQLELTSSSKNLELVSIRIEELFLLIEKAISFKALVSPKMQKAIEFIEGNFSNPISIDTIAEKVNLNRTYLHKLFKSHMKESPMDYVTRLRIEKAKKLMRATSLSTIEIAVEVGYNSRQGFFKAFKKITGISPSEYISVERKSTSTKYIQTPYEK